MYNFGRNSFRHYFVGFEMRTTSLELSFYHSFNCVILDSDLFLPALICLSIQCDLVLSYDRFQTWGSKSEEERQGFYLYNAYILIRHIRQTGV